MTEPGFSGPCVDMVVFRAGGFRCAVEASQVRASRPLEGPPGSRAVPALAPLLGLPETPATGAMQALAIRRPQGDAELSVDAPVQLQAIPAASLHRLPPLLAARTKIAGLRALVLDREGVAVVVDIRSLVDALPSEERHR